MSEASNLNDEIMVTSVSTAVEALQLVANELKKSPLNPDTSDRIARILDAAYSLAWGFQPIQRELGTANICAVVTAILSSSGVYSDANLAVKCLHLIQALCRHGKIRETSDDVNISALRDAGACAGN